MDRNGEALNQIRPARLDRIDCNIVHHLDVDSRQSYRDLGRSVGIPPETARYRVRALEASGIVHSMFAVADLGKLGLLVSKVLLRVHNVGEREIQQIITRLSVESRVNWLARVDGSFDIALTFWERSITEASNYLDILRGGLCKSISSCGVVMNSVVEFLPREYLKAKRTLSKRTSGYKQERGVVALDPLDSRIVSALGDDSRISDTSIGERTGVSPQTVSSRIKRLHEYGVLTGYHIAVDAESAGLTNYYVLVFLRHVSTARVLHFIAYCRAIPAVTYIVKCIGSWDYELNLEVSSAGHRREVLHNLSELYADVVDRFEVLEIIKVTKLKICPPESLLLRS